MGSGKPISLTDISYSEEEENQTGEKNQIGNQRAEDALPVKRFRTKADTVNHTCTHRPHNQEAVPDLKLAGFSREARRVPEDTARQQ